MERTELASLTDGLAKVLTECKLRFTDIKAVNGSSYTLCKVFPASGVQVRSFKNKDEEIAIGLGVSSVRITVLSDCIGIEIPRKEKEAVYLPELIKDEKYRDSDAELPVLIGENVVRSAKVIDLVRMPHLLIAGDSGQGQTAVLRSILLSLLWKKSPDEMKLILIDTRGTGLTPFKEIADSRLAIVSDDNSEIENQASCIIADAKRAEKVLLALNTELEQRYEALAKVHVSKLKEYHSKIKKKRLSPADGFREYPYIVCVCDDYADIVTGTDRKLSKSIESSFLRLAQKGRAVGIHLILSTGRTGVDVISALVKSNFPARIAFRVTSRVDSMTLIDCSGAEKLTGGGDALFSEGCNCERIQAPFCDEESILQEISTTSKNMTRNDFICPAASRTD